MTVGARLPDFDLETSGGDRVTNADLEGRRTVLYFYPKDDTPGCTHRGPGVHQAQRRIRGGRRRPSTAYRRTASKKHQRFIEKCSLGIPLISDPERLLIEFTGPVGREEVHGSPVHGGRAHHPADRTGRHHRARVAGCQAQRARRRSPGDRQRRLGARSPESGSNSRRCSRRRVVFVAGKGGTGRSTMTAALALLAARAGKRVLAHRRRRQGRPRRRARVATRGVCAARGAAQPLGPRTPDR